MDIEELKRAAKAARTITHEIEGRKFSLLAPTAHELRIEYLRAGGGSKSESGAPVDRAAYAVCERMLLERALVDWQSVTVTDVLFNGDGEYVAFDATLIPVLLDAHPEWASALSDAMTAKMSERRTESESARKN